MLPLFTGTTQAAVAAAFLAKCRAYIRDVPAMNALLDGVETTDTLIELCLDLALDDFNTSPPLIGQFTLYNHPSQSLVLIGKSVV